MISEILFFTLPIALLITWGISLGRYQDAKSENKKAPESYSAKEIKSRKIFFIVMTVLLGIIATVVIGFMVLMFFAIAFM